MKNIQIAAVLDTSTSYYEDMGLSQDLHLCVLFNFASTLCISQQQLSEGLIDGALSVCSLA